MKKIILTVVVLLLVSGGFSHWWQDQADVRELNKTLPDGVKVVKSLFGEKYGIVNKIDGYEFKAPAKWTGIKSVEYVPERQVEEKEYKYTVASMGLESFDDYDWIFSLDMYKTSSNINLLEWAQKLFQDFGLEGMFEEEIIGNFKIVKTQERKHLANSYVYFLKSNSKVYVLNGFNEGSIQEIILNGKW